MKNYFTVALLCSLSFNSITVAFAVDDYILKLGEQTYEIGLSETKQIKLPSGETVKAQLKLKDIIQYNRPYFNFSHTSKYKASTSDLGDGVFQTMIATAKGTVIIVQEYDNTDPSTLVDLMINKLTKEEVDYGYTYEEKKISKDIGKFQAKGKRATTVYKDDHWVREVSTVNGKDCGLLIITTIDIKSNPQEQYLIEDFWKSLEIKL